MNSLPFSGPIHQPLVSDLSLFGLKLKWNQYVHWGLGGSFAHLANRGHFSMHACIDMHQHARLILVTSLSIYRPISSKFKLHAWKNKSAGEDLLTLVTARTVRSSSHSSWLTRGMMLTSILFSAIYGIANLLLFLTHGWPRWSTLKRSSKMQQLAHIILWNNIILHACARIRKGQSCMVRSEYTVAIATDEFR